jgi:hypothetical protein
VRGHLSGSGWAAGMGTGSVYNNVDVVFSEDQRK